MVRQIGADATEVDPQRDPHGGEVVRRSDPGAHQDRGAGVGARTQDHPARLDDSSVEGSNPCDAGSVEDHLGDVRVGPDRQVRQRVAGREVGVGRHHPDAVARAHRHAADADGARPVVVPDDREPDGRERIARRRRDLGQLELRVSRDRDRPAVAVPGLVAELGVGLQALEIRQDIVEAPALVS